MRSLRNACVPCSRKGHYCLASVVVDAEDPDAPPYRACVDCQNERPCAFERAAAENFGYRDLMVHELLQAGEVEATGPPPVRHIEPLNRIVPGDPPKEFPIYYLTESEVAERIERSNAAMRRTARAKAANRKPVVIRTERYLPAEPAAEAVEDDAADEVVNEREVEPVEAKKVTPEMVERAMAMYPAKTWHEIADHFGVKYATLYWHVMKKRKAGAQLVPIGETKRGSAASLIDALDKLPPRGNKLPVNALDSVGDGVMISISVSDEQFVGLLAKLKPESRANVARFAVQELLNS